MNPIEYLRQIFQRVYPTSSIAISRPLLEWGFYWLDLRIDEFMVVIQWQQKGGFGVSSWRVGSFVGYGVMADEVYYSLSQTILRVTDLVSTKFETLQE